MATLGHAGQPPAPHDLWSAWNAEPLLIAGLLLAVWLYRRGRDRSRKAAVSRVRTWCFAVALLALAIALLSPLDALAGALASAHMVQHVLLVLVAAPLLAFSAPTTTLLRGAPLAVRRAAARWRSHRAIVTIAAFLRHPLQVWLLHVATLWFWHAAGPYGAALQNELVHALEHATFLLTGILFWRVVIGHHEADRVSPGLGVLLVFAMGMQSVFLSLLLTFAGSPWYAGYAATAPRWNLEPLADQQLAGVIMWIPAGLVYIALALMLLATWIRETENPQPRSDAPGILPLTVGSDDQGPRLREGYAPERTEAEATPRS